MTNQELFDKFYLLTETSNNIFDKYCAIKEMEEEYKSSSYAKAFPEQNVFDAYKLFELEATSIGYLLSNLRKDLPKLISQITEGLDLTNFFDSMDLETAELFKQALKDNLLK